MTQTPMQELTLKLRRIEENARGAIWLKAVMYRDVEAAGAKVIEPDLFEAIREASIVTASHIAAQPPPVTPPKSAADLLSDGIQALRRRAAEYDDPAGERSAPAVAEAFRAVTGKDLTASDVWLVLLLLKAVRLNRAPGRHDDSATDGAVYFALMGESKGGSSGPQEKHSAGNTATGGASGGASGAVATGTG